ncbi:MAG: LLM class F420-dependent oxidoreductase [Acidimicrobiia bacterium]
MIPLGVQLPLPYAPDPDRLIDVVAFAREAERLGFESIWFSEHVVAPFEVTKSVSAFFVGGQVPGFADPLVQMGQAAAVTERVKLGTGVLIVPEHQPIRLAKALATIDRGSNGRLILGAGTGWLEEESEIMGVDFAHRWTQTREALDALKLLWTGEPVSYDGTYYSFPTVRSVPRPAQRPHPPIYLGGVAAKVLERVVRHGDGWNPEKIQPDELRTRKAELHHLAREAGRDPATLPVTVMGKAPDPDLVHAYFEAGADRVVVMSGFAEDTGDVIATLRRIADTFELSA